MSMKPETDKLFKALLSNVARYYNADLADVQAGKSFAVQIPQASILLDNIQTRSDFLQKINVALVKDIQGARLYGATEKAITGRKKVGRYRTTLDHTGDAYKCVETDSGIIIPWQFLDQWARHGEKMAELYAKFVQNQIVLDMLQIAWMGTSVAENTTKQDLSDVNKGWLQFVRENKAANVVSSGKETNKIKVFGENADYANLDALAYDLKQGIDLRYRDRNDLVFLVGADLVAKQSELILGAHALTPTERAALNTTSLMSSFGGMPAMTTPNLPARSAVVTTLDNLSIYIQEDSIRRGMKDDDELKGVKDSYYRNEAYVVEDCGRFVAFEPANIKLPGDSE